MQSTFDDGKLEVTDSVNVDAAKSRDDYSETVGGTKSTDVSSPNRTKSDGAKATGCDSCSNNDKSVSATTKATVVPTFKLTLSGQVTQPGAQIELCIKGVYTSFC